MSSATLSRLPITYGKVHLPYPTGPYSVIGYHDIMTGTNEKNGIFVRVMYPAHDQSINLSSTVSQWPSWYPHSNYKSALAYIYSNAVGHVVKMVQYFGKDLYLPILRNQKLLCHPSGSGWPLIVFSHGLSSIRTTYTNIATHFASLGFIVAAVEHRDSSAFTTMFPGQNGFDWLPFQRMNDFGPYDGAEHFAARQAHIRCRVTELSRVVDLLQKLNTGETIDNVFEPSEDYESFRGQVDLDKVIAAGHSFGAATALFTLAADQRFKLGLCLDSWMFSLKDFDPKTVTQPLIFINMDNFHSDTSLLKMREFVPAKAEESEDRKVFKVKGGKHTDISDFPLLLDTFPKWITSPLNWVVPLVSKVNPFLVHAATVSLCFDFIKKHIKLGNTTSSLDFPPGVELEEGIILKSEGLARESIQEMVEIGHEVNTDSTK